MEVATRASYPETTARACLPLPHLRYLSIQARDYSRFFLVSATSLRLCRLLRTIRSRMRPPPPPLLLSFPRPGWFGNKVENSGSEFNAFLPPTFAAFALNIANKSCCVDPPPPPAPPAPANNPPSPRFSPGTPRPKSGCACKSDARFKFGTSDAWLGCGGYWPAVCEFWLVTVELRRCWRELVGAGGDVQCSSSCARYHHQIRITVRDQNHSPDSSLPSSPSSLFILSPSK